LHEALEATDPAIARADDIALPILDGSKKRVADEIAALRSAGYRVTLILADLPIKKAVDRAIKRFMTTVRLEQIAPS
jgi:alkanesulfonate monooxygenase SsuD/methylene tetrahydromethanopterin reductase-like flavin-dependent oxidoreductase (luciferase family)